MTGWSRDAGIKCDGSYLSLHVLYHFQAGKDIGSFSLDDNREV